jgi:hypothetical protein
MGILGLFRKDFRKLREAGDRYVTEKQWGLARAEYQTALERWQAADGDDARAAVERGLAAATDELYAVQVRQGDAAYAAELDDEALDHFRTALGLTADAARRTALEAKIEKILEGDEVRLANAEAMADEEREATEDAFYAEDPDERFSLLLEGSPEEVRERYLELGPEFRDAYLLLHGTDAKEDTKEALARFDRLLKADEPEPLVQLERGRALLILERHEEAERALTAYNDAQPDDPNGLRLLAEALQGRKKWDEALEVLEDVRALKPDEVESHVALAMHHLTQKEWDDGLAVVGIGMEHVPYPVRRIPLWRAMGALFAGKGEEESAITAWEKGIEAEWEVDNDTGELHFDRECAWLLTGMYAKRKEHLDRAMDLLVALERGGADEQRWQLLLRRGQLEILLGHPEEAREALMRARATAPESGEERAALEKLLAQLQQTE